MTTRTDMTDPISDPAPADETPAPAAAPEYPNDTLVAALARHGIELPGEQVQRLEEYARRLWDWNEKLNLTRHTTWEKFVTRDVVDARQLAALIAPGESVLDVGTGGGVPGVLIAIMRPDVKVTVCDPVGKKAKAVEEMVSQMQLPVRVLARRAEAIVGEQPYDVLVVRAVASLSDLLGWFVPVWESIGRMLIIKGSKWLDERAAARHRGRMKGLEMRKAAAYPFPATESESVVLKIWLKGREEPGPS